MINWKKIFPKVNIALFLLLVLGFATVLFYPVNPLTINSVQVEGETFKAGGELTFQIDRCKSVDEATDGTSTRYLVDQTNLGRDRIFLSSTDDLGVQGCLKAERKLILPAHVPDSDYKLCFVVKYYPSVLRPAIKKEFCSENTFRVEGLTVSAQLENILNELKRIEPTSNISALTENKPLSNAVPAAPQNNVIVRPQSIDETVTPAQPQNPEQSRGIIQNAVDRTNNLLDMLLSN
jgi:hypothetical protein